jgi:hypothetical protein
MNAADLLGAPELASGGALAFGVQDDEARGGTALNLGVSTILVA